MTASKRSSTSLPASSRSPIAPIARTCSSGVDYDLDTEHYEQSGFPDNALQTVLDARQALLESAVTLEVVDKGVNANNQDVQSVVVQNNLLGHNFPTGFAFARQFWLEVTAKTADGQEVCLVKPSSGIDTPCSSGVVESAQDELRQCDPVSIQQALAADPTLNGQPVDPATVGNLDIKFSAAFPANDCDPWLTNYQKILTDGDPQQTGTFTEVAYQSFLPDIVKLRTRVATQQVMRTLDPIREVEGADGQLEDRSSDSYDYTFDTASLPPGTKIVVTAKLRFRHLPPYFVRGLAEGDAEQERIPEEAKINDPDALLKNMVITDVVSAETDGGVVLACDGPQNEPGASVFSCIGDETLTASRAPSARPTSWARCRRARPSAGIDGSARWLDRRGGRRRGRGRAGCGCADGLDCIGAGARATL